MCVCGCLCVRACVCVCMRVRGTESPNKAGIIGAGHSPLDPHQTPGHALRALHRAVPGLLLLHRMLLRYPGMLLPQKSIHENIVGRFYLGHTVPKKKQLNITGKHSNVDLYIINWYILLRITISYIELDHVLSMTLPICNERKGKGTKFRGLFYDLLETIKYMSVRCEGPM